MRYQLNREQQLDCDIDTAWDFFSNPYNLSRITPKEMGFKVLTQMKAETIYEGMKIAYRVSPMFGIPMKWESKITQVEMKRSFTDIQEKGPYKLWHHHHEFLENDQGILMKDKLDYELPCGVLGRLVHALIVKKKLKKIFDYRFQVLEEMFNRKK